MILLNTQISNPNLHPDASKQVQEQEFCQNHDHLVDAWKMKYLWFIWNKLELWPFLIFPQLTKHLKNLMHV